MTGFLDKDEALFLQTLRKNGLFSSSLQDADGLMSRFQEYAWIEKRDSDKIPTLTRAGVDALASHDSDTGLFQPNDVHHIKESEVAAVRITLQVLVTLLVCKGHLSQSDLHVLTKMALDKARESRAEPSTEPSRRYRYLQTAIKALSKGWM